jgi:hypothetical protein
VRREGTGCVVEFVLDKMRLDGGTQSRLDLSQERIADYADNIDKLPPVLVYFDGTYNWLVDGFHRWHAHKLAGRESIAVIVVQGSLREAVWASFAVNKEHDASGIARVRGDKTRAIEKILADSEWKTKTGAEIAAHVGVAQSYISQMKKQLRSTSNLGTTVHSQGVEPPVVGKDGKSYPARYRPRQPKTSTVTPKDVERAREVLAELPERGEPDVTPEPEPAARAVRPRDQAIAARDEQIGKLLSDGMTDKEITKAIDVTPSMIQQAKTRLGLRAQPNPLRRLTAHAQEFGDALRDHMAIQDAADDGGRASDSWGQANQQQVSEALGALAALSESVTVIIKRLNKEAKRRKAANGQVHQVAS